MGRVASVWASWSLVAGADSGVSAAELFPALRSEFEAPLPSADAGNKVLFVAGVMDGKSEDLSVSDRVAISLAMLRQGLTTQKTVGPSFFTQSSMMMMMISGTS